MFNISGQRNLINIESKIITKGNNNNLGEELKLYEYHENEKKPINAG